MNNESKGFLSAFFAFLLWGILPIYWKQLKEVPSIEILAHRVFWSFLTIGLCLLFTRDMKNFLNILKDRRIVLMGALASVFVSINWGLFIYAVNSDHLLETSLGYFINPILTTLAGVVFFKEKISKYMVASLAIASMGILYMTLKYGKFPVIAVTLAVTFCLYGIIKKRIPVSGMMGLFLEVCITMPIALVFLFFTEIKTPVHFSSSTIIVLIFSGVATSGPLLLFAKGAKYSNLSVIAFLQYIVPISSFLMGVFLYKEVFSRDQFIGFLFIWIAIMIYIVDNLLKINRTKKICTI